MRQFQSVIRGFCYGDPDRGRHIAVTDDKEVICVANSEGFKKGIAWLHEPYAQGLIDPEAFTQDQYRLDWIKDIYTPDMNHKYVYPNVFMSAEDTKKISDLSADISKSINTAKADWIMNGFTDADWDKLQSDLDAYGLKDYLAIFQKYLDAYYA